MSLSIILSGILFCIASLWFVINFIAYKYKANRMMKNVKMLDCELPIVGNIFLLWDKKFDTPEDMFITMTDVLDGLTEDRRLWLFNHNVYIAATIDTIEKVLASQDTNEKSYFYKSVQAVTDGVFSAPLSKWRKLRKRLNATFNPKFFPRYIDLMNYQCAKLINRLQHSGITADYQDIHKTIDHYFFDTITSSHFGINTKQQEKNEETVAEQAARCTEYIFKRISKPLLHNDKIFAMTELYRILHKSANSVQSFVTNFAIASEKYQKTIDSEQKNKTGWKSYAKHVEEYYEETGLEVTPAAIGKTLFDVIIAGADTSAVVLSTLLYHIGLNPEYQEQAYNEIMKIIDQDHVNDRTTNSYRSDEIIFETIEQNNKLHQIGDSNELNSDWEYATFFQDGYSIWTKNKLDRLTYIDMLIKEAARMASPVLIFRYLPNDLDVGDHTIPKGTDLGISLRSIHRNPEYYERPDEFYPQHFSKDRVKARPKMAFIPFSYGPRDCPGKAFGVYGMKCALVEILRHFKVETKPPNGPVVYKCVLMVEHSQGYHVKLIPR